MGCSSSAHGAAAAAGTPHVEADATEIPIEQVEDLATTNDASQGLEVTTNKVLPMCDNDNIVQAEVDRHLESAISRKNIAQEFRKDDEEDSVKDKTKNEALEAMDDISHDVQERLSRLEEVVDKVVELYISDNNQCSGTELNSKDSEQSTFLTLEQRADNEQSNFHGNSETESGEAGVTSGVGEPASPAGQAAGSRAAATRWEALADIAAELPPSLAVDPLTGQIYALTK